MKKRHTARADEAGTLQALSMSIGRDVSRIAWTGERAKEFSVQ
jgi:hypothetical protein